ncbi:type VII secretion system-associated protein [Streptomyces sp. 891-h]|uniref:type VII secretion system-associated protein n=1 Tax=Streptomyces sp. 891-h TaxID=2720714 RepID=UPI00325C2FB1
MSETQETTEAPEQAVEAGEGSPAETAGASQDMPPVPEEIREAGRLAPDHWLGMVDPTWQGEGTPPAWALVGQWRSSPEGEIVEWQDNEEYQPSPKALGWPEPADEVDAAVQLAATGYGPGEDVTTALAASEEVAVFVTPDGDPLPATAPDGETAVVPVFTSPVYLHTSGRLAFALHPVRKVLEQLPEGHLIYLNPSAPVSMTVETDALREALDTLGQPGSGGDAAEEGARKIPDVVGRGIPVLGEAGAGKSEAAGGTKASKSSEKAKPAGKAKPVGKAKASGKAQASGKGRASEDDGKDGGAASGSGGDTSEG